MQLKRAASSSQRKRSETGPPPGGALAPTQFKKWGFLRQTDRPPTPDSPTPHSAHGHTPSVRLHLFRPGGHVVGPLRLRVAALRREARTRLPREPGDRGWQAVDGSGVRHASRQGAQRQVGPAKVFHSTRRGHSAGPSPTTPTFCSTHRVTSTHTMYGGRSLWHPTR